MSAGGTEDAMQQCTELEGELAELRAAYEQYFLGNERLPPLKKHDGLKKQFMKLKGSFVRQTAAKFRIESIGQKILTYERLWGRTLKEIEAGTYKRDLAKLKRRTQTVPQKKVSAEPDFAVDEDLDLSDLNESDEFDLSSVVAAAEAAFTPNVVSALGASRPGNGTPVPQRAQPKPPAPAAVAVAPPPKLPASPRPAAPVFTPPQNPLTRTAPGAHAEGGLSDTKIKAIYEAFVMAKKRCGEDVRTVTLDAVSTSIKKQVPELMKQHNAKSVEFRVIIKDGKAVLRALPKT